MVMGRVLAEEFHSKGGLSLALVSATVLSSPPAIDLMQTLGSTRSEKDEKEKEEAEQTWGAKRLESPAGRSLNDQKQRHTHLLALCFAALKPLNSHASSLVYPTDNSRVDSTCKGEVRALLVSATKACNRRLNLPP